MRLLTTVLAMWQIFFSSFLYASSNTTTLINSVQNENPTHESIFDHTFEKESFFCKIEINKNCISFFTEHPWDPTVSKVFKKAYACRGCYNFIYHDDEEHKGLHKSEETVALVHTHIKHKKLSYICQLTLSSILWLLYQNNLISRQDYRDCKVSYKQFFPSDSCKYEPANSR